MQPKIIIFDVNETLLNLIPLKEEINAALKNEMGFDVWFPKLLQYSLVETTTGNYSDFSEIAAATFKMISGKFDKDFSDVEISSFLSEITKLPAYPDVKPGLEHLKDSGFKLIAFSNGKPDVLKAQLEFAKLDSYFYGVHSVDEIERYKPHPDAYRYILKQHQGTPKRALLVAAHAWDIMGAQRAGLQTCFVERPGKVFYDLAEKPTYSVKNISDILEKINPK